MIRRGGSRVVILGAGVTGLAAGYASGRPVYEALDGPGGICSSYYLTPGSARRSARPPRGGEAYRFEVGGGHWIFGGEPATLRFIGGLTPMKRYIRRSSVYLRGSRRLIPYPLQNHLRYLGRAVARNAAREMESAKGTPDTMARWLKMVFGPTLYGLFFKPFHERYTAGLFASVAPQDPHKSPVHLPHVRRGAVRRSPPAGYNVSYLYPRGGLDFLCGKMAAGSRVHYGRQVERIDVKRKEVHFTDFRSIGYDILLSTLPLNRMMDLCALDTGERPDPYTSVLVLNIGAERGEACPDDHWIYVGDSKSGFHRVGVYSNVDPSFLPRSARARRRRVALYVERAYPNGLKPSRVEIEAYTAAVVAELRSWGYIGEPEVLDPTWINVAYTWSYPDSAWRPRAIAALERRGIRQIGRYGQWRFQGIADSIRDGLLAGKGLR